MSSKEENIEVPDGWIVIDHHLVRSIPTSEYGQGVGLVFQIAKIAGEMNHHPDITLSYSGVLVTTISHDVDRITQRDVDLAHSINELIKA